MPSTFNNYVPGILDLLPEDAHAAMLAAGSRAKIKAGQLFQNRGSHIVALCIVLQGRLRMMTIGVDGSVQLNAIIGPGQQFNEPTLFANSTRPHDVEAVCDSEILILDKPEFEALAEKYPSIVRALMVSSVNRLHQVFETLNDLRALPKSVALARVLIKNARHLRIYNKDDTVELDITQEDIAMFLGISRAYLNKILGQLVGLGLIEVSYRKIRILKMSELHSWIVKQLTYDIVETEHTALF